MKWLPSKLGAEPKKLAVLGVLLAAAAVAYLVNRSPSIPEEAAQASVASAPAPAPVSALKRAADESGPPMPAHRGARDSMNEGSVQDFRPSLKPPDGVDVAKIDPTLRLDLLAKVQQIPMQGGARSLFEFSQPPPPPVPKVAPIKVSGPAPAPVGGPPKPPVKADPKPPPPPPIPLKFYGYAGQPRSGPRKAFFLDGDPSTGDIFVAGENDTVKNRYKIIRIGVNSAVVEDTTNKNQQTLPLVEELGG